VLISLRPTTPILIYSSHDKTSSKPKASQSQASIKNLKKERFCGDFTEGAKKRAYTVGSYICERYKRRLFNSQRSNSIRKPILTFITLTYPSNPQISAQQCKRQHLNNFLIELSRRFAGVEYLWRAELQNNGRLHFHILVNKYIDRHWLASKWDNILKRNGFYQDKNINSKAFKSASTNIEQCRTARGVKNYLLKYVCKTNDKKGAQGRQWGSNITFDTARGMVVDVGVNGFYRFSDLYAAGAIRTFSMDYVTCVLCPTAELVFKYFPELIQIWLNYLDVD
jgi:hypothetical protein